MIAGATPILATIGVFCVRRSARSPKNLESTVLSPNSFTILSFDL